MPKLLIVGNWKMEPQDFYTAQTLFDRIKKRASRLRHAHVVVCPPFIYLSQFSKRAMGKNFSLGSQDVHWELGGAHTGEISPDMLRNAGISYVIIGHSERRTGGETNEIIAKKLKTAIFVGLRPIVCVGERLRDTDGQYLRDLREQIQKSLAKISKKEVGKIIIAYEPIWAIGPEAKGADTPEATHEIAIFIKKVLADLFGKSQVMKIPVLYGGSVDEKNAPSFLVHGGVAGLLVGRASLRADSFAEILNAADKL